MLARINRYSGRRLEGLSMRKIDPAYMFELGDTVRKVRGITAETHLGVAYFILDSAADEIDKAVNLSVYNHLIRAPCRVAANQLVAHMRQLAEEIMPKDWETEKLPFYDVNRLTVMYTKFETLFLGELQSGATYLVSPKGGFDTDTLIENGNDLFPSELIAKAPEALGDLKQATRCVAYELPTAAGFHLHRGHESVLRVYWDSVTNRKKRPRENNMGVYLRELDKLKAGKEATRLHLRSIKDFHRNPLMHPEQSLESVDEAIDLLAAIRSSIGYMLREIPRAPAIETVLISAPTTPPDA